MTIGKEKQKSYSKSKNVKKMPKILSLKTQKGGRI